MKKIKIMDLLKTSSYDYYLPENLIAQAPVEPRDSARMLVYDRSSKSPNAQLANFC